MTEDDVTTEYAQNVSKKVAVRKGYKASVAKRCDVGD